MTEPSQPSGYTYPTYPTTPPPYAPPSSRGTPAAAVVALVVGVVVIVGMVGTFVFGMGTHATMTSTTTFVPGEAVPLEPEAPVEGPFDGPVASALLSAGEAEAAYQAEHGTYTGAVGDLRAFSYVPSKGVRVDALIADGDRYCLRGTNGTVTWYVSSDSPGSLTTGSCG